MNFNSEELSALVSSDKFTIQGHLLMYKAHKKKKKLPANWSERWFGLLNNILFCMKGTTKTSGCSAVIILEHCCIELDSEDEQNENYVFFIRQAGSNENIYLAAKTEMERTEWVTRLHEASYENMRMQLDLLREQVLNKTGHDPITLPIPQRTAPNQITPSEYMELKISCHIHHREEELPPDINLDIFILQPPDTKWKSCAQTETVVKSFEAEFTQTFVLEGSHRSETLKIIINKIDNVDNNNRKCHMGKVEFKLLDLVTHKKMILNIRSLDLSADSTEGRVEIMFTGLKKSGNLTGEHESAFVEKKRRQLKYLFNDSTLSYYVKRAIPTSISVPKDRTTPNYSLAVLEILAESNLTFRFPQAYLQTLVDDVSYLENHIKQLTEVNDSMSTRRAEVLSQFSELSSYLYSQIKSLQKHIPTRTFKRSTDKGLPDLESIPTNLHINRLIVSENNFSDTKGCYDIITVGAFTAYTHGYKKGGLLSKFKSLNLLSRETANNLLSGRCRLELMSQLHDMTALHKKCSTLSTSLQDILSNITKHKDDNSELNKLLERLYDHERLIINLFSNAELSYYIELSDVSDLPDSTKTFAWSAGKEEMITALEKIISTRHQQGGSTVRDADVMFCASRIDKLFKYLCDRLSYAVIKHRLSAYYRDLQLQKRLIIVVSQAVTSAVTGIISTLRYHINDSFFLNQISKIGLLMHFESLLSCYKSEEAMMEDFYVGVWYLQNITFKVYESNSSVEPKFISSMCIEIPLPSSLYSLLPAELIMNGFRVVSTLFNIGINEQAMLASWRDKLELQEKINTDSFNQLNNYFTSYKSLVNKEDTTPERLNEITHVKDMLTSFLQKMCDNKKRADVLKLSMQICRELKGVRFTSCKSAKDRTGMSITLEESYILQEYHDLSPTHFKTLLSDLRSNGVRRENIRKNTGANFYAFSSIQLKTFPELYRPPNGTYGAAET